MAPSFPTRRSSNPRNGAGRRRNSAMKTIPRIRSHRLKSKGYEFRLNFEPPQQENPAASVAHFLTAAYTHDAGSEVPPSPVKKFIGRQAGDPVGDPLH